MNLGPLNSDSDARQGPLGGWPARLHVDMSLLTGRLVLSALGLMVLYSATGQDLEQVEKQVWRLALGFVVMFGVAQVHPVRLQRWSPFLYGAGILLLLAVMLFGDVGKGAQRWLDLKVLRFQPSEMVKIAVPMMVAWFLAASPLPPSWRRLLAGAILTAVPVLMIAKQPDLGTTLLVASAGLAVLFLAGVSYRLILGLGLAAAASLPLVWTLLRDYQKQRILTLFDPESTIVWIDWRGNVARTWVFANGVERRDATVGTASLALTADGCSLSLDEGTILRSGRLRGTGLRPLRPLALLLPRWRAAHETKWLAQATFSGPGASATGWAPHEEVTWP